MNINRESYNNINNSVKRIINEGYEYDERTGEFKYIPDSDKKDKPVPQKFTKKKTWADELEFNDGEFKKKRSDEAILRNFIKDTVKHTVNEAMSTPNRQTIQNMNRINWGKSLDYVSDNDEIEEIVDIHEALASIYNVLSKMSKKTSQNGYVQKISEHATIIGKLLKRWKAQLLMKQGEQPDVNYSTKHEKPRS